MSQGHLSALHAHWSRSSSSRAPPSLSNQTVLMGPCRSQQLRALCQFSSVAQSCLTLLNTADSSTPGLPVHQGRALCREPLMLPGPGRGRPGLGLLYQTRVRSPGFTAPRRMCLLDIYSSHSAQNTREWLAIFFLLFLFFLKAPLHQS